MADPIRSVTMTPDRYTDLEIAELVRTRVDDRDTATVWIAIILAESGGDPVAYNLVDHNPNEPSYLSTDNGLFQINSYWHGDKLPVHLANRPDTAWLYAHRVAELAGGHTAWNAYKSGAYRTYLDRAAAAVDAVYPPEPSEEPEMVVWHDRTEWVDPTEPISGPAFPPWSDIVDGIVIHYPGTATVPADPAAMPQHLRDNQHYYLTERGYSYGYNFVIDPAGDIWTVRGFEFRNAANKGASSHGYNVNHRTLSIQVMYPNGGTVSDAQMSAVRAVVAEAWRRSGVDLPIRPHSDWDDTSCPGDDLRARVAAGDAIPQPDEEPDDMAQMRTIKLRLRDRDGTLYNDQVFAVTIGNPETLTKLGLRDAPLIEATLDATRAEIEAQLGFPLSPAG